MTPEEVKAALRKAQRIKISITVLSLGLIGAGASWIYPPAGPIAVGILLWLDLSMGGRHGGNRQPS